MPPALRRAVRLPVLLLIRFYQRAISPWTPPSCRYYPSCSAYAYTAVERHGLVRGGWLALRRLGRCHPWAAGGIDHVPPARDAAPQSPAGAAVEAAGSDTGGVDPALPGPVPAGRDAPTGADDRLVHHPVPRLGKTQPDQVTLNLPRGA